MNGVCKVNEFVQFAQKAVKAVSNVLPFSISLTDDQGLIVGDSDSRRIGTYHEPSQQVILENKLVLFDESTTDHTKNIYPGAAVPLPFDFEIDRCFRDHWRPKRSQKVCSVSEKLH